MRAGWFPIRVYANGSQTMVDWCRLGDERFEHAFFGQTVSLCLRHPFNLAFRKQTPIAALGEREATDPGLEPSGSIFHLSRSGSTLVSRMFGALESNLVMSEPNPVDAVLRAPLPGADDETRVRWLRWLIGALGRRWGGNERRYFIKYDPWAVRYLPLFARAFPGVPWIFLYRDPVEVLVSQQRELSYIMLPIGAPSFFGIDLPSALLIPPLEYQSRVLARLCQAALDSGVGPERLVNYSELPSAVWTRIAPLFGFEPSDAEIERMRNAASVDAKEPTQRFQPDAAAKQREAGAAIREAADRWVTPLYEELERRRLSPVNR